MRRSCVKNQAEAKKISGKSCGEFSKSVPLQRFKKAIDCLTKKLDNKMKKLVFMFVAMAAVSFASCGGSENKGAAADSTATDSVTTDSVAGDSLTTDSAATVDTTAVAAPAPAAE